MEKLYTLVNPVIGTGRGNCLIGPYRPFSLVRLGPDTALPHTTTTGRKPGAPVIGFSHTHVAGTGGASRYGNIRLMPFTGAPLRNDTAPFFQVPWQRRNDAMLSGEQAAVGYYTARQPFFGVGIELTSTPHTGMHRYRFEPGREAWLSVDPGACIQPLRTVPGETCPFERWEEIPVSTGGFLEIVDRRTLRGRADLRGGWGNSMPYSIYFQIEFDHEIVEAHLSNRYGEVPTGVMKLVSGESSLGMFRFGAIGELNIRVGISPVSIANAEASLRGECGAKSFEQIRRESEEEWERLFERFRIEGGTEEERILFYTMLYRLYCMPTDLGVDRENPFWKSGRRSFTDYYTLWDSVRCAAGFFLLFDPEFSRDMLNNLLDIAAHSDGWLPDAFIANRHAYMQGGCSAAALFAEAAQKGLGGVDYAAALRYIRRGGEQPSPAPLVAGQFCEDWEKLGYLSTNVPKGSVSRHIEYAFLDWCTAKLAETTGAREIAERYEKQSRRIWNLWDEKSAMFAPKTPSGEFIRGLDAWKLDSKEMHNDLACCEAPLAAWCLDAYHDFPGLIRRMGGPGPFIAHLDRLFDSGVWYLKETMVHVPHLYTLAERPDRSADRVREALKQGYHPTADGLSDDEDFGCQSSWFLWNSLGLFPLIGHTIYLLTPPLFDRSRIQTGSGTLTVQVDRSSGSRYIAGVKINGRTLERAWVEHRELLGECELAFRLSDTPGAWGQTPIGSGF